MKATEAINKLIADTGFTKADVARAIGITAQGLNTRINKTGNPGIATVEQILDVLGYQVVLTRKGAKLPSGAIVLNDALKKEQS